MSNNRVSYFYNGEIGKFHYSYQHPMKPKRIAMTHELIKSYGIYQHLNVYNSRPATYDEMAQFHQPEYVEYLGTFITTNLERIQQELSFDGLFGVDGGSRLMNNLNQENPQNKSLHNIGEQWDCPGFDGVYNFSQLSTGGSIDCAHQIINGETDIAINWGGGLHHAKKCEASGFCYVNDIVIAILELLKFYPRVLYIDIDVHHGDGVEEAFYTTNRVMTLSFHQYDGNDFFPGTGYFDSIGDGPGKFHSLNFPLKTGVNNDQYREIFKNITNKVMETFRPDVIVFQSGADSLANDKLGSLNLSSKGHGECLTHCISYGKPIILLGGGGYNVSNVAKSWSYETALCVGQEIPDKISENDIFYNNYKDKNCMVKCNENMPNQNKQENLDQIQNRLLQYLKELESAPSVPFHQIPDTYQIDSESESSIEFENNILFNKEFNKE